MYKINCECQAEYIGQTMRSLYTRLNEHKSDLKKIQDENNKNHNRLALHAQKTKHKIDFENVSVLHFENNWNKRVTAESMAMIAKTNVISQPSRAVDKIFWKTIKDDEKDVKGKPFFSEKANLKSMIDTPTNAQPNTKGRNRTQNVNNTPAGGERETPMRALLRYDFRPRTPGRATSLASE